MTHYDTLKDARKAAASIDGTYRKVCGGYIVMSWDEYHTWKKQK